MHNLPAVDEWISGVLSGSGLPMDRRAEIGDEWRDHLCERIAKKRATGMMLEEAVETTLIEFGNPARLCRQLRRGQRARDLREVLAKTRPIAAWTIGGALCAAAAVVVFLPGPAVLRLAGGCVIFVTIALLTPMPAFAAGLVGLRVKRRRPTEEFHAVRSFVRWTFVVAAFFAGIVLPPLVVIGLIGYFAQGNGFLSVLQRNPATVVIIHGAPWVIWRNIVIAVCESPIRSFVIPPIMILTGAAAITFYQRSRCVATTAEVADE